MRLDYQNCTIEVDNSQGKVYRDGKLYKDFGEDKEVLVCYHCRCDVCEKDYARWSETHDDYNMYTDEAISTP